MKKEWATSWQRGYIISNFILTLTHKEVAHCAPSPKEKRAAVTAMIDKIEKLMEREPCEILILDESHFSSEPYLVRGWFKKRWPPQNPKWKEKRKLHRIWVLEFNEWVFLLEAIQAG